MILAKYINDLLYKYDCVIIPHFGGFVTNKVGAKIDEITHVFYPPTKQITFNSFLKHNDGLLANHIATQEEISFEQANKMIAVEVSKINAKLHVLEVQLDEIGKLFLNLEKQVCFEPNSEANFLINSFGFKSLSVTLIERDEISEDKELTITPIPEQEVVKDEKLVVEFSDEKKVNKIPVFIKYAAAVAILLTLGTVGITRYNSFKNQNELIAKQDDIYKKIHQATFIIEEPLPTISLSVSQKNEVSSETNINEYQYHIIAGAFRLKENAEKKVNQLKKKGFNAVIVGENKWGLVQVAYASYKTDQESKKALRSIRKSTNNQSWILFKKMN